MFKSLISVKVEEVISGGGEIIVPTTDNFAQNPDEPRLLFRVVSFLQEQAYWGTVMVIRLPILVLI